MLVFTVMVSVCLAESCDNKLNGSTGETEHSAIDLSCSARTYAFSVWRHDSLHLHLAPFHTRLLQSLQGRDHDDLLKKRYTLPGALHIMFPLFSISLDEMN